METIRESVKGRVSPAVAAVSHDADARPAGPNISLPPDADRVAGVIVPSPGFSGKDVSPATPSAPASSSSPAVQQSSHVLTGHQQPHGSEGTSSSGSAATVSSLEPGSAPQASAASKAASARAASATAADGRPMHQPRQDPLATPLVGSAGLGSSTGTDQPQRAAQKRRRERRVPSSPFSRVMGFAGLGASLVVGTVRDSVTGYFRPRLSEGEKTGNAMMTEANAERLANALCRMRGAVLLHRFC